jgi:hypothetical protein
MAKRPLTEEQEAAAAEAAEVAERAAAQPKQSEVLVRLAEEGYTVRRATHEGNGNPMAFPRSGPNVVTPLKGSFGLRPRLAWRYRATYGRPPSQNALTEAMAVLEGMAMDQEPVPVYRRVGMHEGGIVLDIGDAGGQAVHIRATGWQVIERSPIPFVRVPNITLPLPVPQRDGDLDAFIDALVNIDERDYRMLKAYLVHALFDGQAHVIARLQGQMGTAKTSSARACVKLIDPSTAMVRGAVKDMKDWGATASAVRTFILDNLSYIPDWMSDMLCKAVTGEAIFHRTLYTDGDVNSLLVQRVMMMTTIGSGGARGDLVERILPFDVLPVSKRLTDAEVDKLFEQHHAAALGALLDLAVMVLQTLPRLDPSAIPLPRMADYALVLVAVDHILGKPAHGEQTGFERYLDVHHELLASVAQGDPVAIAFLKLIEDIQGDVRDGDTSMLKRLHHEYSDNGTVRTHRWKPAVSDLLATLDSTTMFSNRGKGWPQTPRNLSDRLRRLAPSFALEAIAIEVGLKESRKNKDVRYVQVTWHEDIEGGQRVRKESPSGASGPSGNTDGHQPDDPDDPDGTPPFTLRPPKRRRVVRTPVAP